MTTVRIVCGPDGCACVASPAVVVPLVPDPVLSSCVAPDGQEVAPEVMPPAQASQTPLDPGLYVPGGQGTHAEPLEECTCPGGQAGGRATAINRPTVSTPAHNVPLTSVGVPIASPAGPKGVITGEEEWESSQSAKSSTGAVVGE